MLTACIALGSNLGDRELALRQALDRINALPHTRVLAVSRFRETHPVDSPPDAPLFINAAAVLETTLPPGPLMDALLAIEQSMGRQRDPAHLNAPRTIDLDLLLYNNRIIDSPKLTIPHPRMHQRLFVLEPLAEITPDTLHPKLQKTIRELLTAHTKKESP